MNYHTMFSVTIQRVSEQEATWLREALKKIENEEDGISFEHELDGTTLWLHGTQGLDEQFLDFLQEFFQEKRPNEYVLIDYACTADRSSDDAYAGGVVFGSAHTVSWSDVDVWKRSCLDQLAGQVDGPIREADATG